MTQLRFPACWLAAVQYYFMCRQKSVPVSILHVLQYFSTFTETTYKSRIKSKRNNISLIFLYLLLLFLLLHWHSVVRYFFLLLFLHVINYYSVPGRHKNIETLFKNIFICTSRLQKQFILERRQIVRGAGVNHYHSLYNILLFP